MQLKIKINAQCKTPQCIIETCEITNEIQHIIDVLTKAKADLHQPIPGFQETTLVLMEQQDIIYVATHCGKVIAKTNRGMFTVKMRLYEIEKRLDPTSFTRISNAQIINLKKVSKFDLRLSGTICAHLSNGEQAYVSRRYIAKLKQTIGI